MSTGLTDLDLALHEKLGIPRELLERARVQRVSDREARELLSINGRPGDFAGIEYPYVDPISGHRVHSRVRLDHPPVKPDGRPDQKYRSAFGDVRHLYFPPGSAQHVQDVTVPAVVVEAEKSALALTAAAHRANRRLLVIATGGCWSWRGCIGKAEDAAGRRVDVKGALADFDRLTWGNRPVVILFDSRPNGSVDAGRRALGSELRRRGADVRHGRLPDDDHRVNGPDDLIAVQGDHVLWGVLDRAEDDEFIRSAQGTIVASALANIRLALRRLGVAVHYDDFVHQVSVDGRRLDDALFDDLLVAIDDEFRFRPPAAVLKLLLGTEARLRRFHPVCQYLSGLVWDGKPRLDHWLPSYGGATAGPYVAAVGAIPLIAAVRRVREPGCKFDELLVLESPQQGTFKSSALRALSPLEGWFSDDLPLGATSKEVIERTTGKWLIEAAEMIGQPGRAVAQLKAFLSRQVDGPARLAYDRLPTEVPRQFVIIGTTNATTGYLKDATGGRRFWPVRVRAFDVAALQRDRDQLWAEAAARESAGESIRLSPELWATADEHQDARRAVDPWEERLEYIFQGDQVRVSAIWTELGVDARAQNNNDAGRIDMIAQRFGFTQKKMVRLGAKSVRCWVRDVPGDSGDDAGA